MAAWRRFHAPAHRSQRKWKVRHQCIVRSKTLVITMGLAFAQAAVIFFWVQVTMPVPLSSLHYNWAGSSSTIGAIRSISRGKAIRVSLVSILVTITTLLRGPLMQRASYVQVVSVLLNNTIDVPITLNVSSLWGRKYGSLDVDYTQPIGLFAPGFSDVVRDYLDKAPMRIPGINCENCTLTIKAFGFDVVNCTELRNSSDTYHLDQKGSYKDQLENKVFPKNLIFETTVMPIMNEGLAYTPATISTNNSMMKITTRRKADTHCNGTFLTHTCILNPGAVLYDLSLQGDIATLQSKSWKDDRFVEPIYPYMQDLLYPTENTVLPLSQLGTSLFNSSFWMQFDFTYGYAMNYEGLIANLYAANWTTSDFRSLCYQYFNDPMDYIINSYREIAFRMSIRAAAGHSNEDLRGENSIPLSDTMQKGVPYTRHSTQVQYAANRPALALAVIVSLVGPVAILFLFWGWWRLGRDFSMSPLELANAFLQQEERTKAEQTREDPTPSMDGSASDDASIHDKTPSERPSENYNSVSGGDSQQQQGQQLASVFTGISGNASADKLANHFRHLGQTKNLNDENEKEEQEEEPKVQYGVVESGTGEHLGFAVVSGSQGVAVRRPWKGESL